MIKIAICDDNLLDAKGLYKIIADYFDFQNIKAQIEIFNNGNEFLPNVKNFQLLILDIMLSNELGTDLAKKIHSKNSDAQIMFYSSNLEFAPDAFDSYGNGFITKPLNKKKIYTSLDRVMKKVKKRSISFREIINNLEICIDINDIEYISSSGKYTIFHIKNKEFKSNRGIKEWESELEKDQFFLCKRGLLINLHRVDFIDEFGNLILSSGEKIFLSELIVKRVKEKLLEYWSNNI